MIPERYRRVLPSQWYENEVSEYHFEGVKIAIDAFNSQWEVVLQQFSPWTATWGLDIWDWIYFGKKQSLSIEERRKNIQRQHWANLGFTPSVLRAIGLSSSRLKNVRMVEDYGNKAIRYVYPMDDTFDTRNAVLAIEKIRSVHCNGVVFEPVQQETIVLTDELIIGLKEYHKAGEFRVGMTPIKRFQEVVV